METEQEKFVHALDLLELEVSGLEQHEDLAMVSRIAKQVNDIAEKIAEAENKGEKMTGLRQSTTTAGMHEVTSVIAWRSPGYRKPEGHSLSVRVVSKYVLSAAHFDVEGAEGSGNVCRLNFRGKAEGFEVSKECYNRASKCYFILE